MQSSIGSVTEVAQAVPQTAPSLTVDGKAGALHVGHAPAASKLHATLFTRGPCGVVDDASGEAIILGQDGGVFLVELGSKATIPGRNPRCASQ